MNSKLLNELTTTHIRRGSLQKLKLLAVLQGKTMVDCLADLLDKQPTK